MKPFKLDSWNVLCRYFFLFSKSNNYKCHIQANVCVLVIIVNFFFMGEMSNSLPIDNIFNLPSPLPTWSPGGEFASGVIDLGGLQVRQVLTFNKIWQSNGGGPDNLGASFFEPSPIPDGYSMLGSYAQPNNQPLFGWVLVGKTDASDQFGDILKPPIDYTQVYSAQDGTAYFWLPTPPQGFQAVGHIITTSPSKPSLDKIRCVRSNFTDQTETDNWIWGENGINIYGLRPVNRGITAQPLSLGTFFIQNTNSPPLACLKNNKFSLSAMPNLAQMQALFQTYSPIIYLHPKETHVPSSVNWYFSNGALLYTKGDESNPVGIQLDGSNLPQGGSSDGSYWLDLPVDKNAKDMVARGDLQSAETYLHVKPMLGATFTDIQVWLFYPFNGHAVAKLGIINEISLGKIGEHVGDWEHVTLRISNFDGVLRRVYFAEHSGGTWIDSHALEFVNGGGNKFVGYSSLNGHATYYKTGLDLHGRSDIGIRNDTGRSDMVWDTGAKYLVVAAQAVEAVVEPPWLNFAREWGPKIDYNLDSEVKKIERFLIWKVKSAFEKLVKLLPSQVLGEEGPTGPKMKSSWSGDEK